MKMFCPLLTKPAKGAKRVPNGGFWRFWHVLSVAVAIFLKSQRTAISGNSVATIGAPLLVTRSLKSAKGRAGREDAAPSTQK